jgi:hypothetical protein
MRVVNERKWRRAKLAVLLANTVALLWCMGGLEGEEPMPNPTAAVLLMFTLGYMTHNLTKHWKH